MDITWTTLKETPVSFPINGKDKNYYLDLFKKDENVVYYPYQFNYKGKSKKRRMLKKVAKRNGYTYSKPKYLLTDILVLLTLNDIKETIDGRR